jgi:hypothetical protein
MDNRVRYRDRFTREAWRTTSLPGIVRAEARRYDGSLKEHFCCQCGPFKLPLPEARPLPLIPGCQPEVTTFQGIPETHPP